MLFKEGAKFLIFVFIVLGVVLVINFTDYAAPEQIKLFLSDFGNISAIIFILITAIATAVSVPLTVFTFVGAVLFGIVEGTIVNSVAAILGSVLGFYFAKLLGRKFVQNVSGERLSGFQNAIKDKGFMIVFVWRLAPLIPFSVVNYAAGLSQIRFVDYFLATIAGQIPNTFVLTYLSAKIGERLLSGELSVRDLLSPDLIIPTIIFIVFIVIPMLYHRKYH